MSGHCAFLGGARSTISHPSLAPNVPYAFPYAAVHVASESSPMKTISTSILRIVAVALAAGLGFAPLGTSQAMAACPDATAQQSSHSHCCCGDRCRCRVCRCLESHPDREQYPPSNQSDSHDLAKIKLAAACLHSMPADSGRAAQVQSILYVGQRLQTLVEQHTCLRC